MDSVTTRSAKPCVACGAIAIVDVVVSMTDPLAVSGSQTGLPFVKRQDDASKRPSTGRSSAPSRTNSVRTGPTPLSTQGVPGEVDATSTPNARTPGARS